MKILILGGTGMLGHKMFQLLGARFPDTFCTVHGQLDDPSLARVALLNNRKVIHGVDAYDWTQVADVIEQARPDVTINCIGLIKQLDAAKAALPSITINALLPHRLADLVGKWGGRLIHFSTDCVFNGRRGSYRETDLTDAEDLYGRTKALGEVLAPNALTLRTSIIGRELRNYKSLLEWLLAQEGKTVRGFARAIYTGVTTNHLAGLIASILANDDSISGLYQVASTPISKFDLLRLLRDAFKLNVEIVPDSEFFCNRSLCGDKFSAATGYRCPPWPDLAAELANDLTPYEEWKA